MPGGYRTPAYLAKIAPSVDLICRGRLTLGIGASSTTITRECYRAASGC
jgi:alkanesulfonate monooxygenase SsuD/methylene tetrahydromethanopterin reductase-like flavin-dependent oxidoreductase (luciferase family)